MSDTPAELEDSGARFVDDTEKAHRRQSHQQLTHPRWVSFHRDSPELDGLDTINFAEPLLRAGDAQTPLRSEEPRKCPPDSGQLRRRYPQFPYEKGHFSRTRPVSRTDLLKCPGLLTIAARGLVI